MIIYATSVEMVRKENKYLKYVNAWRIVLRILGFDNNNVKQRKDRRSYRGSEKNETNRSTDIEKRVAW